MTDATARTTDVDRRRGCSRPTSTTRCSSRRSAATATKVAFSTSASLTARDTNTHFDIYVHNMATGANALASRTVAGSTGNKQSIAPWISSDGRYVAFSSRSTNLAAGHDRHLRHAGLPLRRPDQQDDPAEQDRSGRRRERLRSGSRGQLDGALCGLRVGGDGLRLPGQPVRLHQLADLPLRPRQRHDRAGEPRGRQDVPVEPGVGRAGRSHQCRRCAHRVLLIEPGPGQDAPPTSSAPWTCSRGPS